jgi:hypothetical protein
MAHGHEVRIFSAAELPVWLMGTGEGTVAAIQW